MTDDRASSRRMAEIYGYVDGRWVLIEAMEAGRREDVLRRAREISAGSRVQAVRLVMEKADEDGGTRSYVAWRAQKRADIPELDLSPASRARRRPAPPPRPRVDAAEPAAPEPIPPPPIPPPLIPPDPEAGPETGPGFRRPDRRTIRIAALGTLALGALLVLLVSGRSAMDANADLVLGTGAGLVLMASGLWIARDMLRVDIPASTVADGPAPERTAAPPAARQPERKPEEDGVEAPVAVPPPEVPESGAPEAASPDRVALLPVLRLTAAALRRLEDEGGSLGSGPEARLALRLYVAGACDERAARLDMPVGTLVAGGLELLGESAGEAAGFAAAVDDALLSPGHQILYRAGRLDLASFAERGGRGPTSLHRLLPGWLAWCAEGRRGGAMASRAVLAVAPLAPDSVPAVEAVVGAFGGEAFSRDGTALVATFPELSAARAVAEAVRDAAGTAQDPRPGCGLVLAEVPHPGRLSPHRPAAEALELARLSPGPVATGRDTPPSGMPAA
jgi:hypothetical protein